MKLVKAGYNDFENVKSAYINIIDKTPGMKQHALWEYGKHPSDMNIL